MLSIILARNIASEPEIFGDPLIIGVVIGVIGVTVGVSGLVAAVVMFKKKRLVSQSFISILQKSYQFSAARRK